MMIVGSKGLHIWGAAVMKKLILLLVCATLASPAYGQIISLSEEQMIEFTKHNPFDRFPTADRRCPIPC